MIARDTGQIAYSDRICIPPSVTPSAIPASVIRKSQAWRDQNGRPWQAIHLRPVAHDCEIFITLRFCGDALFSAEFCANIFAEGFDWHDWTVAKELERKEYHDRLLRQWVGPQTTFDWGEVWSNYDPKGGFSTFGVTYRQS